ncbi:hypothetical protein [Streptomyces netropsis]|uniref:hypothetical protein n=1 Tax=Streptomyces netropsis TaxID=55404 RepID=UPI0040686144
MTALKPHTEATRTTLSAPGAPRCSAQPGSPCRSRSGAVADTCHTGRNTVAFIAVIVSIPGWPAPDGAGHPGPTNGQPSPRLCQAARWRSAIRLPSGSTASMRTPNP